MPEFIPSLENRIHQFLAAADYEPLKQHELAKALELRDAGERSDLRRILRKLELEGKAVRLRKNRWALAQADRNLVSGVLRVHPNRFGFVTAEEPGGADVYVREDGLGTALDGDRVVVRLSRRRSEEQSPRGGRRRVRAGGAAQAEGSVVRVLERRRTSLVGLLCQSAWYWYVIPDSTRVIHTVRVRDFEPPERKPVATHKVVVRLDEWNDPRNPLTGVVVEDLGPAEKPGVDILSIIRDHQIEDEFPEAAVAEAQSFPPTPPPDSLSGREDLTERLIVTVDPEDAKDYDDAVSLERTPSGGWRLGVHIADVSHYVTPGSRLDREAALRGNTVYMVDRTIPMLPAYLTSEVCSLRAGWPRLTHTVEMEFDSAGSLEKYRTFPSVIRSAARLTYDQTQQFLDGRAAPDIPEPVRAMLADMRQLARTLRAKRMQNGSIDLAMPEVRCVLDGEGRPVELRKRGASEAYNLIEEFMLAANCVVARVMADKETPAIYRIHPAPSDEQWAQMSLDLGNLDIHDEVHSRAALNRVARAASGPATHVVHLSILRNLKRALYSPALSEHFGLAFDCYTHFTSPIRRYPDLIVHRILKAIERNEAPPVSHPEAARVAAHCSQTERNADEAEEESLNVKRIEYYENLLRAREVGPFEAIVTTLTPKGLIVELADTLQRGMVPFHSMRDDYYALSREGGEARGRHHNRTWRVGRRLMVTLARVDSVRRLVDFHPVAEPGAQGAGTKTRKKTKARRKK